VLLDSPATNAGTRVLNVAHRGASGEVAENTYAAVLRAVELGADLVEVDVRRSRDGALVLMHDATLVRTTNVRRVFPRRAPWRVADFTYDELLALDAGSWHAPHLAGEPVPTLAGVIELVRRSATGLLVEVKTPQQHPGIVSDVAAALRESPGYVPSAVAAGRLVVESFDFAAMKELKSRLPSVPVGLLGTPARSHLPVLASWADQVNPSHLTVDASYVEAVHEHGMSCLTWTVNRPSAMRRCVRMGVDGVITNRPAVFAGLA
jgi:glycerophosphoryl diester phosphodiesterase